MTMFRGTFGAIQTLALAGSFVIGLGQTGCEKKRGLRFTQGSGDNLYEITQFEGDTFKVKTGAKRFKGQTSRADELLTLNGFDKINNLDAVEFEIEEGLFAGIDISDFNFYGRENFEYTFKYSFTDYHVILSKVAAKSDIPSQELTFATEIGNGQYEVPLMGLPISLFTVEQVKDERGKPTRQLNTYKRDFLNQASHFKVNPGQVKYFDAPAKPDLLTADFFNPNDEWFFTKTLVGRSISSEEILGSTESALKIKFARTNNSLLGVDLNIAKEQEVLDPTKTITALEIPVQWVDFRTETAGSDARLKENMLGDKEGSAPFWKERKYALVDFNNADRLDKAFTLDNKLEKLELSEDYVSFTIYESSSGNTYKYSLAKSNRKVEGQTLFADDAKMFHIFTQRRTVIHGALQSQDPDIDRLIYATRFYPENGEIVYHLSQNSPNDPEFLDATKAAIQAWDDAFQEANTGIRVRLADERVELGDVRYNTIVLYGYEIDSGNLLGFGPSVQDTRTGETYSAATHIYLRAYREGLITSIRNFVRNELGLYDDKAVQQISAFAESDKYVLGGGLMNTLTPNLGHVARLKNYIDQKDMFAAEIDSSMKVKIFGSNVLLEAIDEYNAEQKSENAKKDRQSIFTKNGPKCEYGAVASVANSWEKIRRVCASGNTKFADYLARLKAEHTADSSVLNVDGEEEAILECAQPLMRDLLTSTLIHEVGHNLGLGHNFSGSSDSVENQARNADGTIAYPSSTVMDYPDRDFDLFSKAGPYDVAAIRFLYGRQVETTDKQFITVPKNQSMFAAARKQGKELRPFKMCTDYEFDFREGAPQNIPTYDPMCTRWDVGSTPEKYVKWAISQIHADLIQNGYRYNNKGFSGAIRSLSYLDHFKQIQEYFRFLVRNQAGVFFEKLNGTTAEEKKAALERIIENSRERDRELLKSYYAAVNEIFKFGREVMDLPSRVCVIQDAQGKVVDVLEFVPLRQRIFEENQITVQNCKDAALHAEKALTNLEKPYAANVSTMKFEDRGIELTGLELDLDPAAAADKWKQLAFATYDADLDPRYSSGTSLLKSYMAFTLTSRVSSLLVAEEAGVGSTNFLDYPWFAEELYQDAWTKLLVGTKGELLDDKLLKDKTLQHYQESVGMLSGYLYLLYSEGLHPLSESLGFAYAMQPKKERSLSVFEQGPGKSDSPIWYATNTANEVLYADSGVAAQIIRTYVQITQLNASYRTYSATNDPAKLESTLETLKTTLSSLDSLTSADERMFTAAAEFLKAQGLSKLQPAQKVLLRSYLKKEAAAVTGDTTEDRNTREAKIVLSGLGKFSDIEMLDTRIFNMAVEDSDNLSALLTTLNVLISQF
ncbi:zinc-dependent metalloprotease [Oligoflexus tunisiensis]|uniref:zinc-dependent metalloprotease n=1 Tax=Oligoflexus tunisiensis TaxID=708132 RepID=UPI00114CEBCD|nr:zinc-dependent metalloprotease [Oligoflexus tunisiensis]